MNQIIDNPQDSQRLGQLKNLVMLAAADGHLTDSELAVLLAVASRENISPDEFNKVIDAPVLPLTCPMTRIPNLPTCVTWWQ